MTIPLIWICLFIKGTIYIRSAKTLIAPIWAVFELGLRSSDRWDEMCYASTYFTLVHLRDLHNHHDHYNHYNHLAHVHLHTVNHGPNDKGDVQ